MTVQSSKLLDVGRSFRHFAADIKLAHSVFALPFAMAAFIVGRIPLPDFEQIVLLLICMVTARSFAMGMNRYLDHAIDAENPRTKIRKIPSGALTPRQGLLWSLLAAALFVAAAARLSPLAGYCSVPMLVILMSYSFMKKLSWTTHWYLGMCLGLAPLAVSIALTGQVSLAVLMLGAAVALWTAGFDILYSLQDMEFDRQRGLHSVPGRFGPAVSLWLSRASFLGTVALLAGAGALAGRTWIYFLGVALVGGILAAEHWLVRDAKDTGRSRHINLAFFNLNAYVSVVFFVCAELDYLVFG
jgi:4-hydroxybenzoate polyprenyltransferase